MKSSYKPFTDYKRDIKPHIKEIVNKDLTKTSQENIIKYLEDCRINLKKLEYEEEDINEIFFQRIEEFKTIVQEDMHIDTPIQFQKMCVHLDLAILLEEAGIKNKDYEPIIESVYILKEALDELNIFIKR